uniref:CBP80/20-dependent translation initiation factor isoform X2 n=2 Tax=Hirondellea gigas TaxID=1518452 RepID=A0A6A7FU05_9CRUS
MPAATAAAYQRPKPAMQLYRPPTLRVSDDYAMMNGSYAYEVASNGNGTECSTSLFNKAGLNINAKEFVSLSSNGTSNGNVVGYTTSGVSFSGPNGLTPSALKHSKSSSQVLNGGGRSNGTVGLHHSRSSSVYFGGGSAGHHGGSRVSGKDGRNGSSGGVTGSSPPLRVHFTDDTTTYDPDNKAGMIQRSPPNSNNYLLSAAALQILPIKRSKSLGSAADLIQQQQLAGGGGLLHSPVESASATNATNAINDMAPFSDDLTAKLHQLLHAPNAASARVVMEVVRQLFNKLIQGSRYAEPAARYCIAVIEKESGGETFLETLLNTCQEYYQERDRLLRTPAVATPTRPGSSSPPQTHTRWVSYMTFLHEMYTQVKRRQRTVVSSTGPGLLLLTLLAECCVVSLDDQAKGGASMTQTECLFFILTGVGKDIELELPPLMSKVMRSARDALFTSAKVPAVRKTLLQLIEMNAASWALPAPAVMYYYPGVAGK